MSSVYLDSYCERAGDASLWAEPLNAVTNLAFVVAALMAWLWLRRIPLRRIPDCYALAVVLVAIGLGSGAWHMRPNVLTVMLDVMPIVVFIHLYLAAFLWRGFGWRWWQVVLALLLLQVLNALCSMTLGAEALYGTIMYVPVYVMMLALCAYSAWRRDWFASHLVAITVMFTVSLAFRTLDIPFCAALPIGTHYLWHMANAVVLYKLLILLVCIARRNQNT